MLAKESAESLHARRGDSLEASKPCLSFSGARKPALASEGCGVKKIFLAATLGLLLLGCDEDDDNGNLLESNGALAITAARASRLLPQD